MKRWIGVGLAACMLMVVPGTEALGDAWWKTYGGSDLDEGTSVQQTSDGGYILTGSTESYGAGDSDVYLIKTDAFGDTLWTRTYGGSDGDRGDWVQETFDGGYILTGSTQSYGAGDRDVYLIKTDAFGDTLWTRTYGGTYADMGFSVQQVSDGGYIVVGATASYGAGQYDVYLIKTDVFGDTLWTRTYGGTDVDWAPSVQQVSDGGYIVAGVTASYGVGKDNVYLIKTDAVGDALWTRTYGGSDADWGLSIQQTSDAGYILAGRTQSYGAGGKEIYLIKTDAWGDTIWTQTYGGSDDDEARSVQQTSDGGYILAGATRSYGSGENDVYLVKTNAIGELSWTQTYGGTDDDWGHSVQQTSDGGYILVGWTDSYGAGFPDVYLIKTDVWGWSTALPIDLSLSSEDIYTSLYTTEWITHRQLGVWVHNDGTQAAQDVAISIYLGDPRKEGTLITESLRLQGMEPGTSGTTSMTWDVEPGIYEVFVVVDPDNLIEERDETNNIASRVIVVTEAPGLSPGPPPEGEDYLDLALSSEDVRTYVSMGNWKRRRRLEVTIHNNGTQSVLRIPVRFYLGDPYKGGTLITEGLRLQELEPGMSGAISIPWDVEPGTYEVFVVVDPDNLIEERDETNNIASSLILVAEGTGAAPAFAGSITTSHFEITYPDAAFKDDAQAIAEFVEDVQAFVKEIFGGFEVDKTNVILHTYEGSGVKDGKDIYLSLRGPISHRKKIFAHELAHVFDHALSHRRWDPFGLIREGLGVYVEVFYEQEIEDPALWWALRAYWAYRHGLVDLQKLRDFSEFCSDYGRVVGYSIGYTFWRVLIEHWGTEGLVRLIQAKGIAEDYPALFQQADIDYETFMRHWMDMLQAGWEANQARLSSIPEITAQAIIEPDGEGYARVYIKIRISHGRTSGYYVYLSRYVGEEFIEDQHIAYAPEYTVSVLIADHVPMGTNIRYDAMIESTSLIPRIHSGWRELTITEDMVVTAVEDELLANLPTSVVLSQNFPNPFNAETVVMYALPHPSWVHLSIYNVLGQRIRTLTDAMQETGLYRVRWGGRDDEGRAMGTGIYVYCLKADGITKVRRMVLMR